RPGVGAALDAQRGVVILFRHGLTAAPPTAFPAFPTLRHSWNRHPRDPHRGAAAGGGSPAMARIRPPAAHHALSGLVAPAFVDFLEVGVDHAFPGGARTRVAGTG